MGQATLETIHALYVQKNWASTNNRPTAHPMQMLNVGIEPSEIPTLNQVTKLISLCNHVHSVSTRRVCKLVRDGDDQVQVTQALLLSLIVP